MKKKYTTAQSEGAEIFSVAELLSRGLISGAYPRNYPDVDVYAFDKQGCERTNKYNLTP